MIIDDDYLVWLLVGFFLVVGVLVGIRDGFTDLGDGFDVGGWGLLYTYIPPLVATNNEPSLFDAIDCQLPESPDVCIHVLPPIMMIRKTTMVC